mmetsp:Transcript_3075/g.7337  ORF Transcript_3075/g.7337 Transcript_3075/m.7337 type:complete len:230 (-) Transcript_3075:863-1552(-)
MPAVGHEHKPPRRVHGNPPARIERAWERQGQGGYHFNEVKCGFFHPRVKHPLGGGHVKLEDGDLGRQLIDNVGDGQRGVELDVPWAECNLAWGARLHRTGRRDATRFRVEDELPNKIHAQVGDKGNLSKERVQNDRVRVGVELSLALCRRVILRVVHMGTARDGHLAPLVRIEHRLRATDHPRDGVHGQHNDGGVPVVDNERVPPRLVDCDVARRCSLGVSGSHPTETP